MTAFVTAEDYEAWAGITTLTNRPRIEDEVEAASAKVRGICGRDFSPHVGADTARVFRAVSCELVYIDDTYDIDTVELDLDDDGIFETTLTAAEYESEPANGVGPDGLTGWPTYLLRAVGSSTWFPSWNRRRNVKVTAKWGWAAIPAAVTEATLLLTNRLHYEVSVPGGVTPPDPNFGIPGAPLMRPHTAEGLLKPYVRVEKAIGIAG